MSDLIFHSASTYFHSLHHEYTYKAHDGRCRRQCEALGQVRSTEMLAFRLLPRFVSSPHEPLTSWYWLRKCRKSTTCQRDLCYWYCRKVGPSRRLVRSVCAPKTTKNSTTRGSSAHMLVLAGAGGSKQPSFARRVAHVSVRVPKYQWLCWGLDSLRRR